MFFRFLRSKLVPNKCLNGFKEALQTRTHTYTHLLIYICIQIYSNLSLLISFTFLLCIIQIHTWVPTNVCMYAHIYYVCIVYTIHTHTYNCTHFRTRSNMNVSKNEKKTTKNNGNPNQ